MQFDQRLLFICPLMFLAGFVDSIAGGGGIISLTGLIAFGVPTQIALGSNKFSASCGTAIAVARYAKQKQILWGSALIATAGAFIGAAIGSRLALIVTDTAFKIVMIVVIPVLCVFTIFKPSFGTEDSTPLGGMRAVVASALIGTLVGTYDGFFGPGSGTFYTLGFTAILHLGIKKASGNARVVNLSSNLASLVTFIPQSAVDYTIAIPSAVFNILGSWVGSGFALKRGGRVIKPIMAIVVALLLVKIVADLF